MKEKIAVIGLGYVGLPVALAFALRCETVGFDIDTSRIAELEAGGDRTGEVDRADLGASSIRFTESVEDLRGCTFFIITVPTPIDASRRPDLRAVLAASRSVGSVLEKGAVVVYESTVYPGVTEEICGPALAAASGLEAGVDFTLGYSPERINPGDREHTITRIVKVVSGQDAATLDRVAAAYGSIIEAGIHRAPSIRVAEAAKVIENTQRDLNIAFMNELSLIFERLEIPTRDVLAAAGTKWNFLKFTPGLVGGHCIGVDPYYLTAKAEEVGYHPEVILAGRRINDDMGRHVAQRVVKGLGQAGLPVAGARVAVLGLAFKPNVPDLRNSRVPDVIDELSQFGIEAMVHDPLVDPDHARHEYDIELVDLETARNLHALILAVPHRALLALDLAELQRRVVPGGVLFDVGGVLDRSTLTDTVRYLSL